MTHFFNTFNVRIHVFYVDVLYPTAYDSEVILIFIK